MTVWYNKGHFSSVFLNNTICYRGIVVMQKFKSLWTNSNYEVQYDNINLFFFFSFFAEYDNINLKEQTNHRSYIKNKMGETWRTTSSSISTETFPTVLFDSLPTFPTWLSTFVKNWQIIPRWHSTGYKFWT